MGLYTLCAISVFHELQLLFMNNPLCYSWYFALLSNLKHDRLSEVKDKETVHGYMIHFMKKRQGKNP